MVQSTLLLPELRAQGYSLKLKGESIEFSPKLKDEQRAQVLAQKSLLVSILREEALDGEQYVNSKYFYLIPELYSQVLRIKGLGVEVVACSRLLDLLDLLEVSLIADYDPLLPRVFL